MLKLYVKSRDVMKCPLCGEAHMVLRMRLEPHGEDESEYGNDLDHVYCSKTGLLAGADELTNLYGLLAGDLTGPFAPVDEETFEPVRNEAPQESERHADEYDVEKETAEVDYENEMECAEEYFRKIAEEASERQGEEEPYDETETAVCFAVTASRIREGKCVERKNLLFSRYEYAAEWLRASGYFRSEPPKYGVRARKYGWGDRVRRLGKAEDFWVASVATVEVDTGAPALRNGLPTKR